MNSKKTPGWIYFFFFNLCGIITFKTSSLQVLKKSLSNFCSMIDENPGLTIWVFLEVALRQEGFEVAPSCKE